MYARLIRMREEQGALSHTRCHRYDHNYHTSVPQETQQYGLVMGLLTAALVFGVVLANQAVNQPTSLSPPDFERAEMG
jgi:hypothetical protein